jgi:S-adenosylmethionine:tRNA ribosyltransferase-isomerase
VLKTDEINLKDYDYNLPSERIALYPAEKRDHSQVLIYKENTISKDIFRNIGQYLPPDSLLVFNDTRVIRARLLFRKKTGAVIEILCLEPLNPAGYESAFGSVNPVEWKCIVGNLKKWKSGLVGRSYTFNGRQYELTAKRIRQEGDAWRILFDWGPSGISFGEVIDLSGQLPLPPYIDREAEDEDLIRYQTVYSRIEGSVAAPTAGLHFTEQLLESLKAGGLAMTDVTLHVGAGTFKPVKTGNISEHEMHCEHFSVSKGTLRTLTEYNGKIIPVGTTSVRTLESLYWIGVKLINNPSGKMEELALGQWDAYESNSDISPGLSFEAILKFMERNDLPELNASTSMIIIPGYQFRIINGVITNFHQPMSTLLLLISAWVNESWKDIYRYALENDFRFLSYGDCSLLLH